MRHHEGKLQEASRNFSFFLENLSIAPLMKQTCGVKVVTLLAVRIEVVTPLLSHVSGVLPTWVTLLSWGRSVTSSKQGKIARG